MESKRRVRRVNFQPKNDKDLELFLSCDRNRTLHSDLVRTCGVEKITDISNSPVNTLGYTNQRKMWLRKNRYNIDSFGMYI